jgi:nucleotide-binding universal stress UspA family protein
VAAWEIPAAVHTAGAVPPLDPATLDAFRLRAEQIAEDAAATAKKLEPSVEVDAVTAVGQPADALLGQGGEAELIVVGRRGLGGFRSLLLGSVSQQVVHYATCPVVVVQTQAPAS